jgi:hypothetical protein
MTVAHSLEEQIVHMLVDQNESQLQILLVQGLEMMKKISVCIFLRSYMFEINVYKHHLMTEFCG